MWESPLAPPPPSTTPIEHAVNLRASLAKSECLCAHMQAHCKDDIREHTPAWCAWQRLLIL